MFKKTSILLAAIALFAFTAPATMAATAKCTVTEVKDAVIILDCGKKAAKLKVGDKVKVKADKKKPVEGC